MPNITMVSFLSFAASIVLQVIALARLPLTRGFTNPGQTALVLVIFAGGIGLLARIQAAGVPLSILIPLSAAAVPLALIGCGMLIYGEPASLVKVLLLVGACGVIGVAAKL